MHACVGGDVQRSPSTKTVGMATPLQPLNDSFRVPHVTPHGVCVCVCACMRACVRVCLILCIHACVHVHILSYVLYAYACEHTKMN